MLGGRRPGPLRSRRPTAASTPGSVSRSIPTALTFTAILADGSTAAETYYSVGGGFIVAGGRVRRGQGRPSRCRSRSNRRKDLLGHCSSPRPDRARGRVAERAGRGARPEEIHQGLGAIWRTMKECVFRGCHTRGVLPGGLGVVRRAAGLSSSMLGAGSWPDADSWLAAIRDSRPAFQETLAWVSCFALAVNEENAGVRPGGDGADQRGRGRGSRGAAVLPLLLRVATSAASSASCSPPARSAASSRRRRRSPPRWADVRRRSASRARWRRRGSRNASAARPHRSPWRPRSPWSTTSA